MVIPCMYRYIYSYDLYLQYQSKKCFRKVLPWYGSTDGTTFNSTITLLKVPKVYYNSSDADCSYYIHCGHRGHG